MSDSQKRTMLIWIMVASVLPVPFIVKMPLVWGVNASTWLYVSAVTGYIGLVGLLWMYILGTKSVVGLYFRDLAPIYRIHTWLGKYGTLLVFAHPIATAISYGMNIVSYSLFPMLGQSFERSVTWGRFAIWALLVVWVTSALIRDRIHYRPWKYLHYLAYASLPLALVHIPAIGSSYRALSAPKIYFMSVLFLTMLFTVLRLRHLLGLSRAEYKITRHTQAATDTMLIELTPLRRVLTPKRGQYVYLQSTLLGNGHPFSVLQYDETSGKMTIAYKIFGPFTANLSQISIDATLFVDGPYGNFTSEKWLDPARPTVFMAGGIGVTPFVDYIFRDNCETWLFYANQRRDGATFASQFSQRLGNRFVPILSREQGPLQTNEHEGHISEQIVSRALADPARYDYYICGSDGFIDTSKTILRNLGVPAAQVRAESFTF